MALTLDELLFEPNAPPEVRRSDIETRFHLMCLNPSRHDLVEFLTDRASRCRRAALSRAELQLKNAMDEHALDPTDLEEFRIFVRGMTELSQVLGRLPSYSNKLQGEASLGAGCRYDFEQAAREILRDGVEFRSAAAKSLEVYRGETRTAIDKALRMVHDGMHEVGVERQEILRDARGYLSEVLDSPECMAEPLLWFYQGWLSWKRRLEPEAAQHAFFQACLGSSPRKDILCRLACRHLAYLQCASGAADAAYATVGQALRIQADHLTLLEFARYAASSGHKTEAVRALARCIELCPMATLDVFAEEEFAA